MDGDDGLAWGMAAGESGRELVDAEPTMVASNVAVVGGRANANGCPACKMPGMRFGTLDEHRCGNDACLVLTFLDPHDKPEVP